MPVIANTHPKGGVGKTTSSVNIVGEMKSDTVDLDTHTGLSIILGLRPEGKEISVKVPKTVDELIEIMTPYKNSDKTLLIDLKWSTKTGHRVRVFPVSIFRFVWG